MKHSSSFFGNNKSVSIISWWGYLDNEQQMAKLEAQCKTEITVKEYTSLVEFPTLVADKTYDIYIYPLGYHKTVEPNLPPEGPDLTALTAGYHPTILKQYQAHNMPKDSLFFQHASLAYVYDKHVLPDLSKLTIDSLFALADQGHVYLMDEIKQLNTLLKQSQTGSALDTWIKLHRKVQQQSQWPQGTGAGFYFSNFISKILNPNLVLGVIDSGELINPHLDWRSVTQGNPNKTLAFGLHPQLSQVNSDIIAVKTHKKAAVCVAKAMGSREFLRQISNENFYFSPFKDDLSVELSTATAQIHQDFYNYASTLSWTDDQLNDDLINPEAYNILESIRQCQDDGLCEHWVSAQTF